MVDILLAENNEVIFENGQIVRGESTEQHQRLLLVTSPGDWRFSPLVGIGAFGFLKDEDDAGLLSSIKQQFEMDGMKVVDIDVTEEKISVDASYNNG